MNRGLIVIGLLASGDALAQPVTAPAQLVRTTVGGRVVDARGRAVAGAMVSIEGAGVEVTDEDGRYLFAAAPIGAAIVVAKEGFGVGLGSVGDERAADIVLLSEETIAIAGQTPEPAGGARMERSELERMPGTGNDLLRGLQVMPGVASFPLPLSSAGIVIRGSSPQDSRVLVDGFEIPRLYHDLGFKSVLPSEAIQDVAYLPGGFDVAFGHVSSGLVDVTTRAGGDTAQQAELGAADASVLAQGRFAGGRGSYLIAGRRSVIDYLLPALLPDHADLTLTTVPRYYDEQIRIDYALSPHWQLRVSSIGSDDALALYASATQDPDKRFYERTRFARLTIGAKYHDGPWTANLGVSSIAQQMDAERGIVQKEEITTPGISARAEIAKLLPAFGGLTDATWRIGGELDLKRNYFDLAEPADLHEGQQRGPDDPADTSVRYHGAIDVPDYALWSAIGANLDRRIRAQVGVRLDGFGRIGTAALQPRAEVQIAITDTVTARLAAGEYVRPPEYRPELLDASLRPEHATQAIAGATWAPSPLLRVSASLYATDRTHLIAARADGSLGNDGRGATYGAELLATYRGDPWFAWVSYAYSHSTRVDAPGETARLFDYDQPHVLNVAVSWKHGQWTLGARFQLSSGLPSTPVVGATFDSDRNLYDPMYGATNSTRAPLHHQLDLRIDRRYRLGPLRMTYFLDIQNVYLDQSDLAYFYSYDYMQRGAFKSLPILPQAGLRAEW